jgi:hypothetical protein
MGFEAVWGEKRKVEEVWWLGDGELWTWEGRSELWHKWFIDVFWSLQKFVGLSKLLADITARKAQREQNMQICFASNVVVNQSFVILHSPAFKNEFLLHRTNSLGFMDSAFDQLDFIVFVRIHSESSMSQSFYDYWDIRSSIIDYLQSCLILKENVGRNRSISTESMVHVV